MGAGIMIGLVITVAFLGLLLSCGFGALLACSTPTWGDTNG